MGNHINPTTFCDPIAGFCMALRPDRGDADGKYGLSSRGPDRCAWACLLVEGLALRKTKAEHGDWLSRWHPICLPGKPVPATYCIPMDRRDDWRGFALVADHMDWISLRQWKPAIQVI